MASRPQSSFWIAAVVLGLSVSAVTPVADYLHMPDVLSTGLQGLLVIAAFAMVFLAIRQLQRPAS